MAGPALAASLSARSACLTPPPGSSPQIVFPNGVPEDVEHSVVPVHPDMIPLTFRPDTSPLLVDPSSAKAIVQVPLIELYRDWEAREARGELAE